MDIASAEEEKEAGKQFSNVDGRTDGRKQILLPRQRERGRGARQPPVWLVACLPGILAVSNASR